MIRPLFALLALAISLPLSAADTPTKVEQVIKQVRPAIATIRVRGRDGDQLGLGTGFVIDPEGLIATNFHVITEGRSFAVEMSSGRKLEVLAVEASDRKADLALVRVDVGEEPLPALELADPDGVKQGLRVWAFGNPLGLRDSVVEGIVSAVREVEGQRLIQIAIPIEQGNSGGPLVDEDARVHGIVNMKSAIDQNLGFAIPVSQLGRLQSSPNPVAIDRWVRLGRIDRDRWIPLFGAKWQQRGGMISARGLGDGFGGRSLCLSTQPTPEKPYEIAVEVRLDDESGAAGLAFCSDGKDRHYGFYPSGGSLRLTCFRGPTVYQWQVLHESTSEHYLPNRWNRLRVRVEDDRLQCFVNGHLVVESRDDQLRSGKFGLVKFRDTNPDFKAFRVGEDLRAKELSASALEWLEQLERDPTRLDEINEAEMAKIAEDGEAASRRLLRRASELEQQSKKMRRFAADLEVIPRLAKLRELFAGSTTARSDTEADEDRLLRGALLIASLDEVDLDVDAYIQRVDEMASEIRDQIVESAGEDEPTDDGRLAALHQYLFEENGFHGGRSEYYHPANSHLHRVIDEREGLPITLSILYMQLGRRIGLTIEGIGLPGHFVVQQIAEEGPGPFIDVFDRGNRMTPADVESMVIARTGRTMIPEDTRPQSDQEILSRVLRNLMGIAGDQRDGESLLRYADALVAINPESAEFRLMRAQLRGVTDRTTLAIEDLDWLLEENPPGLNRAAAEQMRRELQGQP